METTEGGGGMQVYAGCAGVSDTGRQVVSMVAENTWRCLSQGTGLSDSWGGGWSGGGFCCTQMGNSVWGRVLCHKVCSQCCKLARESYSGVKTRAERLVTGRGGGPWRVWDAVAQMEKQETEEQKIKQGRMSCWGGTVGGGEEGGGGREGRDLGEV